MLNGVLGSSQIVPQVGYFVHSLPFNITITAGPPSKFAIVQGNTQSGKGGTVLPLALIARLEDSLREPSAQDPRDVVGRLGFGGHNSIHYDYQ